MLTMIKWLSFMSKRLRLAKNLLKDEGVIFISIDDNELAQLKLLCDEIFGEFNFINNITVKSSETYAEGTIELPEEAVVTLTVKKAAGDDPILSWISISVHCSYIQRRNLMKLFVLNDQVVREILRSLTVEDETLDLIEKIIQNSLFVQL